MLARLKRLLKRSRRSHHVEVVITARDELTPVLKKLERRIDRVAAKVERIDRAAAELVARDEGPEAE